MKTLRRLHLSLLSLIMLLLSACGGGLVAPPTATPERGAVVIGYSAPGLAGTQLQIQQSLERHAKAQGWQLLTTTSGGDVQRQLDQIASYIDLGVDAIVAVPDDSKAICTAVAQAAAADIPFYTIDRLPDGCSINMTVLSDNVMAGRQSGEAIVQFLIQRYGSAQGVVLEITGNMATNVAQARAEGFHAALEAYPEITLISEIGDWEGPKAVAAVRKVLGRVPQLDAVYAHSDAAYFEAVIMALQEHGKLVPRGEQGHVFLTGIDGSPVGLQAIRDGYADQVSNQPIPDFGLVVDWIAKDLRGEAVIEEEVVIPDMLWSPAQVKFSPVGPQLFLATTAVTVENVDDPRLWANQ